MPESNYLKTHFTVEDAAALTGRNPQTIRNWLATDQRLKSLSYQRIRLRGQPWYISPDGIWYLLIKERRGLPAVSTEATTRILNRINATRRRGESIET